MLRRLGRLYALRIVNVNVNIVLAGILALGPTLLVVHIIERLGVQRPWIITAVTFVADIFSDVVIYFALHWLANHWPALMHLRGEPKDKKHLSFFKDATLVQVERAALSPLLYLIFLGMQYTLMDGGMPPLEATMWGYFTGIAVARTLHTIWMLRSDRRAAVAAAAAHGGGGEVSTPTTDIRPLALPEVLTPSDERPKVGTKG